MNKPLLYLLANVGLLSKDDVNDAQEGDRLLRSVCPLHEDAADKTAFVVTTEGWFCNTEKCHQTYGGRLEGLVVGLAHRHGGENFGPRRSDDISGFREAKAWVKRNIRKLRETYEDWVNRKAARSSRKSRLPHTFSCLRETVLRSLSVPSWYFLQRGFAPGLLRQYDIGDPRGRGLFANIGDYAIIPLYDLGGSGRCVGYAARNTSLVRTPRWRFPAGFPTGQRLFNLAAAQETNRRSAWLAPHEPCFPWIFCRRRS